MTEQLMGRKPIAVLDHALGHQIGVPVLFRNVMVDIPKWILQDWPPKMTDCAIAIKTFVHELLAIPKPALPEQLRLAIVGIPSAMANPPSEKEVLSWDKVGVRFRPSFEHLPNLFF